MNFDPQQTTPFLLELCRQTEGDRGAQTSMFDVGAAIGLDKTAAGKLAEELIARGWVEIKTLSGGIGITPEGLEAARAAGADGYSESELAVLGSQPLMNAKDHQAIAALVTEIKSTVPAVSAPYETMEALVVDIKTLEVHLLSPQAKTAVVREILRSLQDCLQGLQQKALVQKIEHLVGR